MTTKLNDVDPQAWLADVLGQIADIPQGRLAVTEKWPNVLYTANTGHPELCNSADSCSTS